MLSMEILVKRSDKRLYTYQHFFSFFLFNVFFWKIGLESGGSVYKSKMKNAIAKGTKKGPHTYYSIVYVHGYNNTQQGGNTELARSETMCINQLGFAILSLRINNKVGIHNVFLKTDMNVKQFVSRSDKTN